MKKKNEKKQKQSRKQMKIRFVEFIVPLFLEFNHTLEEKNSHSPNRTKKKKDEEQTK